MACALSSAQASRVEARNSKELRSLLHWRREWPTCEGKEIKYATHHQEPGPRGTLVSYYRLHCHLHEHNCEAFCEEI